MSKIDPNLAAKVLRFVQVSSALTKRALDELGEQREDQEKAASARDTLVQQMLDAEAIGEHQKEAAEKLLATKAGTQQLLKAAIAKIATIGANQKQAGDLGSGVDPELVGAGGGRPAYDSTTSPYVGARTSEKKASDHAMLSGLGLQ